MKIEILNGLNNSIDKKFEDKFKKISTKKLFIGNLEPGLFASFSEYIAKLQKEGIFISKQDCIRGWMIGALEKHGVIEPGKYEYFKLKVNLEK